MSGSISAGSGTLGSTSIVSRSHEAHSAWVDKDMLVLDEHGGSVFALNETAGTIWELVESPIAVGSLCERLTEEFDVDEATCMQEVVACLERLRDAGLINVVT